MTGPRVAVIGAGVVGAALADELSARGWDDITVTDQGPLPEPGGSSTHAPGLMFQASPSKTMAEMARYTARKFGSLATADGPCFLPVGGLEVATTAERLTDLHRRQGWLASWGIDAAVVPPGECARLYPPLADGAVLGGLHVPADGLAKSVRAVKAQLNRAAARGARIRPRTEVLGLRTAGGRVTGLVTDRGDIPADLVVCCAGIWGPRIARMAGMSLPLVPLQHQLAWTSPLPGGGRDQAAEATRPMLRHQGSDLYVRDRFGAFGIGYYGHRPMPVAADDIASVADAPVMPSVLPFTDEDFAPAWAEVNRLLPATRDAKIEEGINGLFSFTADDLPLLGPSPDLDGFWVAEAVWVTHSAGVGRAMAEWIADGYCSSFDLHALDVNRFEPHQLAPGYVRERGCRNFAEVYDIKHPLQPVEEPRPLRTTPFYERQRDLGAYFLEGAGWERPHWYEANAGLVAGRDLPEPDAWAARYWSPVIGAEAQHTREAVALYDMTPLKRLEVGGPGAEAFLQEACTGNAARAPGAVTYCLLLDEAGGIRSDITVARLEDALYQVGVNGALDTDWLRRRLPADGSVTVTDITAGTCCLGLWGPRARDVLQPLTGTDFSADGLKYFRGTRAYVGDVPVTALRLSYVGELGWELYTTADLGRRLWDTLWEAGQRHGLIAAGRGAFNSLRLEKGYRSFGTDMTHEHDPWEAGVGFAVRTGKTSFAGRDAVLRRRGGIRRTLACLTLDDPGRVVLGSEPVYSGGEPSGYVTSAAYGYTTGTSIAYAWLPPGLAVPGTAVEIGYLGERLPATVRAEPLFDPDMTRLRG
ncbi:MAG: FAD-dependent oxidoreductase [Streptosporangiales bacterium]|nr:FAD-dependent oxidoreductase [Streptosporangiales bacterium]